MKVLYLTVPSFFDLEISLIRELSKYCQVTVMMIVSPESMKSSAFSIDKLLNESSVVRADGFKEMEKYSDLIDLKKWYIANNPNNSVKSCIALSREIKGFIKNGSFDIIHMTTNCKTSLFLMPFIMRFNHKLYTVHDPISHHSRSIYYELMRRKFYFKVFNNLLFLSHSLTRDFLNKYGSLKPKIFYSRLGPYDFLKSYQVRENKYGKYILYFGRISYYKGVDLLIKAFLKSIYYSDGYKLVVAGKGDLGEMSDISDNQIVLINRYIDNSDLANLIRNSEIVVLPYRSATQSGCIMSAFAFNKPVLMTDVGDFHDIASQGNFGKIVKPDSVSELVIGLNYMKQANISEMSENINSKFNGHGEFSWENIAKGLEKVYNEILCQ